MINHNNIFIRIAIFSLLFVVHSIPIIDIGLELVDYNSPTQSHKFAFQNPNIAFGDELADLTGIDLDNIQDLADEFAMLEEDRSVSIASKMKEDISRAPSIVTVITAEEIENIGARTLTDILMIVPGFNVIKDASFGVKQFGARGIRRADEKIKVLVDGHSLNMPFNGSAATFFDDLSLKNVKRIEIIRGPGSALYGANAFLAVINIITKDADDIDGVELASGFGSFDTQEYSILFGKTFSGIGVSGFIDYYNTNGLSDTIKEDALSVQPFFSLFSITPGDTDDSRNKIDLNLKLSYKDIEFNAKYMNKDTEPFVGSGFVLTNEADQRFNYLMADLRYKFNIREKFTVTPRIYYDQYDAEFFEQAVPDGFTIPFDLDGDGDIERFRDGILGDAVFTNRRLGADIQMDFDWTDSNSITLGFNYEWERQDNVTFHTNFDPLTGASLGSIQNVSKKANWIREVYRQIWAVYIQNKWDITDNLGLSIGIRHDHYSDFEGTTNPRVGLVWDFMENFNLKLLYGQAFRAPAFSELYTINNPVFIGNPNLKPETIRTYEIGLGYNPGKMINVNVNYFFNVIRDTIGLAPKFSPLAPQVFDNLNGANIQGVEFDFKADLRNYWDNAYVFANYTYLDAESKGDPIPDVTKHKGSVGVNLGITKYLNANLNAFIRGPSVRAEADRRDDSPGYAIVNFTLVVKDFFKGMKAKASLFNLFDKDYNDPSPINTIPTDLPRPGRTFYIELGYEW
ncbi:MAG: TonB-dependent receptor plug domain-containing protein [Candidatus Anammoxibacter sp.]